MKRYQHFKGGIYIVMYIAEHSETQEQLVVYKNQEGKVYVRPYDMFFGTVQLEGKTILRFKEMIEANSDDQ